MTPPCSHDAQEHTFSDGRRLLQRPEGVGPLRGRGTICFLFFFPRGCDADVERFFISSSSSSPSSAPTAAAPGAADDEPAASCAVGADASALKQRRKVAVFKWPLLRWSRSVRGRQTGARAGLTCASAPTKHLAPRRAVALPSSAHRRVSRTNRKLSLIHISEPTRPY